jgi:hypothetical protein
VEPDFDAQAVERRGWRQGAILGPRLHELARSVAPAHVQFGGSDRLVVTSHDCDVVNPRLEKEPLIEVLRLRVTGATKIDGQTAGARSPRALQIEVPGCTGEPLEIWQANVHERWSIHRAWLMDEDAGAVLPARTARLIAEWLAKRYTRAAFPSQFDLRWHAKLSAWITLLRKWSASIQGVYLRLDRLAELPATEAYSCELLVVVPVEVCVGSAWPPLRSQLEEAITLFWEQFAPAINCDEVVVRGAHEVTLADLDNFQRFDADWVSFADETPTIPLAAQDQT